MAKECSMVFCNGPVRYVKLGVCRRCYNRIWWIHKHYGKTLEAAKRSLQKIDKEVDRQGLDGESRVFQYTSRQRRKKGV